MMRAYVSATTYTHIYVSVKKNLYHIFNSQKKNLLWNWSEMIFPNSLIIKSKQKTEYPPQPYMHTAAITIF